MAHERMKGRDAGVALDAVKVDQAGRAVADAYALEDAKLAGQRRKELQNAEAEVTDLGHRMPLPGSVCNGRSSSTSSHASMPVSFSRNVRPT